MKKAADKTEAKQEKPARQEEPLTIEQGRKHLVDHPHVFSVLTDEGWLHQDGRIEAC